MKINLRLFASVFILSVYLVSCYPEKKILGYYPNGKLKAVRYYKHHDSLHERYVFYYDDGQKQYVRYWRNDLLQVYKMKAWYRNGAKRQVARMKEKDTVREYSRSDSEYVFRGLYQEYAKGWHKNGKVKFETIITKDNFYVINYYDSTGIRIKQRFVKQVRPDGYDTISFKTEIELSGRIYTQNIKCPLPEFELDE